MGSSSVTGPSASALSAVRSACATVRDADEQDEVDGVRPALVAYPTSTEETGQVLRAAAAQALAVVPRGRGTKLTWGQPPSRVDLVVDLSRLDQVIDHAPGDLVLVTQAGTRLDSLQRTVAAAGQRLALDEMVPGASVGGAVATSTSGPHRVLAGTVRDLLIGVTLVRADGVVARAGGRVVKNVAGYDLGKLVTGSFGTLAVVTEAVFRLHPLPSARRFVTLSVRDADQAHLVVQAVVHGQVVPSAVEVDWPAEGAGTIAVLLEGTEGGVAARTKSILASLDSSPTEVADQPPGWWATYPWSAGEVALKLTFALTGLPAVLSELRAVALEEEVRVTLRGSAGAGVLYGAMPSETTPAAVVRVVQRLRAACRSWGGAVVILDGPAAVKQAIDLWGPIAAIDLMRRVKDQFDPQHRLSPGRFVGGI
ncbi:FAD-binding oxidoreductase [Microlunatus panaciterrae]|uniref:Glycolate oxidase FAD binding subunit n=1 Tax=Microlunatus panaciterrae TaxID=400768 RepID=A0ABS2RJ19_9ACTN|nr:FAD-binding oxidoreductase [Microlunatus panaciterrae]MBM7798962.1 glycolate oxidase FAD binding subunit [Microlunatus panaciterrae]